MIDHSRFFRALLFALFYVTLFCDVTWAAPSPMVGALQKASGTATVIRQGQTLPAKPGLEVQAKDTLRTGSDGAIGLVFLDDTVLSLGPDSLLVIDEFMYAPPKGKFSLILKMIKGTAVYLSGLIEKLAPDSVHFVTPSASVGVRGTKFAVKIEGR